VTGSLPRTDFDWVVIGSGFGGSVSALRLAEKGYRVAVLECGRRYEDADYARTTWNWRRFMWSPRLGLKGIMRITLFKDVTVLSGSGVGGGSLVYANTLYRPPERFFRDPQWASLDDDWHGELRPHYDTAERMLGASPIPFDDAGDEVLQQLAETIGVSDTHGKPLVSVTFGEPGENVGDPYFGGEGPDRTACIRCGACMVGCRFNAKNTLVKNYLWLAERRGVKIMPERMAIDIRPLRAPDGSDGYALTHEPSGTILPRGRRTVTTRGVVLAAGALGTNALLRRCKDSGSLPRLSERLGYLVRTNSEAILAVTARDRKADFSDRIAITSSIYPDEDTHIETVTYGKKGNSMRLLFSALVGDGNRLTRPLRLLAAIVTRPRDLMTWATPGSWARRTLILLVMQTLDNSMRFRPRRFSVLGRRVTTQQDPDKPNPSFIPAANDAAERIAEQIDGVPLSSVFESMAGIPVTAHILGGAVIGADEAKGVVDTAHRAFGYERLLVCDGAAVPANPGVNPSLTITALAEHAMSHVPPKPGARLPEPVTLTTPLHEQPPTPAPGTASG
jgi:cholesterol oxidase